MIEIRNFLLALSLNWISAIVLAAPTANPPTEPPRVQCNAQSGEIKVVKATTSLFEAVARNFWTTDCSGYLSVVAKLASEETKGGKRLKRADPNLAARQFAEAQTDSAYLKALATALEGETSPLRRQLIEAAELENFSKYEASLMLLNQIVAQNGGRQ